MNGDLRCFLVRIKRAKRGHIIMVIRNYLVFRHSFIEDEGTFNHRILQIAIHLQQMGKVRPFGKS
jgi:hypothetical protein